MKTLSLEWQIAAHRLMVKLANALTLREMEAAQHEAQRLCQMAEAEYEAQS